MRGSAAPLFFGLPLVRFLVVFAFAIFAFGAQRSSVLRCHLDSCPFLLSFLWSVLVLTLLGRLTSLRTGKRLFAFVFLPSSFAGTPRDHDAQPGFGGVAAPAAARLSSAVVDVFVSCSSSRLSCCSCPLAPLHGQPREDISVGSLAGKPVSRLVGIRPDYVVKLVRDTIVYPRPYQNRSQPPSTDTTTATAPATTITSCQTIQHLLQDREQLEQPEPSQDQESKPSQLPLQPNGLPAGTKDSCHAQSYIT